MPWADRRSRARYPFLGPPLEPAVPFSEGAAAFVFGLSFLGFLASRLPRCSPFGMAAAPLSAEYSIGRRSLTQNERHL
jgi:hypothetical protein